MKPRTQPPACPAENVVEFAKVARAKVANAIALLEDYGIDGDDPLALLLHGALENLNDLLELVT